MSAHHPFPPPREGHDRRAMTANTEPDIHDIALSVLRRAVSRFSDDDTLTVQRARRNTRIIYSPARASAPPADLTRIELHGPAAELEKLKATFADFNPEYFLCECGIGR